VGDGRAEGSLAVGNGVYVFVKCKGKNIHTVTAVYIVGSQLPNIPACQLKSRTCH